MPGNNSMFPYRFWRESDLPRTWLELPDGEHLEAAAARLGLPVCRLRAFAVVELPHVPWAGHYA